MTRRVVTRTETDLVRICGGMAVYKEKMGVVR